MLSSASGDDDKREHDDVIGAALLWKCDDDNFETLSSLLEAPLLLDNLHIYDLRQYIVVVRARVKGLLRSDAAGNVYLMVKLAAPKIEIIQKLRQKKITNKNVKQLANNHVSTHPTTHLL